MSLDDDQKRSVSCVDDVLITAQLAARPSRTPDYEAESRALTTLAEEMTSRPERVLQRVAELARELCRADSAGISVLEPGGENGMFRWHAATGAFAPNLHGTMPRDASPCGTVIARNDVLLFDEGERFFPALRGVEPRIYENLLAPWTANGAPTGTVWVIKHAPEGRFDAEDARLLASLARFASAAWRMASALQSAHAGQRDLKEKVEERTRELRESEDRQRFLLRLSDLLRALADAAEIAGTAARHLGERLEADRVFYGHIDGRTLRVESDYTRGVASITGEYPLAAFSTEFLAAYRLGEVVVVENVDTDTRLNPAAKFDLNSRGVAAFADVVLVEEDQDVSLLAVQQATPRSWTPAELDLIREFGERVRSAIERVRAETATRASEKKYRTLFEAIDEGFCLVEVLFDEHQRPVDYRFLEVNPAFARQTGLENATGRTIRELAPAHEAHWFETYGRIALTGEPMRFQNRAAALDNRWYDVYAFPAGEPGQKRVAILFQDISDRKRADEALRESEERFRLLVENVREYALFQTDPDGNITSWNPGAQRLFGYTTAEMVGHHASWLLTAEDRQGRVFHHEISRVMKGHREEDARWLVRKDGSQFWARWVTEPVRDDAGRIRGVAKVLRDETERRRVEETTRHSLVEKEALLREVHHRVKNNLQVIISLLNMQARHIENDEVVGVFEETRNRVQSIASIHELLYRGESFAGIQLSPYARQLAPDLIRFYGLEGRVAVDVVGDGASLELERAVPYGIVLNELVSNACKHAFPEGRSGQITITIRPIGDEVEMSIADNGKGLPPGFDDRRSSSLGLQLVHALARQLRGTVEMRSQSGAVVSLRFPGATARTEGE